MQAHHRTYELSAQQSCCIALVHPNARREFFETYQARTTSQRAFVTCDFVGMCEVAVRQRNFLRSIQNTPAKRSAVRRINDMRYAIGLK